METPQQPETSVPTDIHPDIHPELIALARSLEHLSPDERDSILRKKDSNELGDALFKCIALNSKTVLSQPSVMEFIGDKFGDKGVIRNSLG